MIKTRNLTLSEILKNNWIIIYLILYFPVCYFVYGHAKLFDDNYIYLQYAKHFIENKELSFNLGEKSYAFTSPLWLIFFAALYPFLSPELIPFLLSTFFSILTILICFYFLRNIFKNKLTLFLAILVVSFDPNFLKHAFNGMETSFTYFLSYLILLGIVYSGKIKNNYLIGSIFGIFLLVRPESIILFCLTLIYLILSRKLKLKSIFQIIFSLLIIILPWLVFTWFYFGKLLPDTFGAKGGDYKPGLNLLNNLGYSVKIFSGNYLPAFILILYFVKKIPGFIKLDKLKYFYTCFTLIAYTIFYSLVFSNESVYARYLCLIFPFFIIAFISFISNSLEDLKKFHIVLASIFVLFLSTAFLISRADKVMVENIKKMEGEIIEWVKINTDKDSYITRSRIGEIGFKTQRRIFDPVGLINRDIAGYNQTGRLVDYILLKKPNYLIEMSDETISSLSKRVPLRLVKEFTYDQRFLLRQKLFGPEHQNRVLKIYKVDWHY